MGILNHVAAAAATPVEAKKPFVKSEYWVNFGDQSEAEGTPFISVLGIPMDGFEVKPITGKNAEWRQMQAAKNDAQNALLSALEKLKPGEERIMPFTMMVQLRRAAGSEAPDAEGNPHLAGLSGLIAGCD